MKVLVTGASGLIGRHSVDRVSGTPGRDVVADISRARSQLGYEPRTDLRARLPQYVASLRTDT